MELRELRCPFCGQIGQAGQIAGQAGWERREWQTYAIANAVVQAGASYERRRPVRAATIASDVGVPVLQSVASGIATGVLGGTLAALCGQEAWLIGLASGALSTVIAWLMILRDDRATLWEIERIDARPETGDTGNTPPAPREMKLEITERDNYGRLRAIRWSRLPASVTDDNMRAIAEAVLVHGTPFSRRALSSVIAPEQYAELSSAMLAGELLTQRGGGPQAGVELTHAGRALLKRYLDQQR